MCFLVAEEVRCKVRICLLKIPISLILQQDHLKLSLFLRFHYVSGLVLRRSSPQFEQSRSSSHISVETFEDLCCLRIIFTYRFYPIPQFLMTVFHTNSLRFQFFNINSFSLMDAFTLSICFLSTDDNPVCCKVTSE